MLNAKHQGEKGGEVSETTEEETQGEDFQRAEDKIATIRAFTVVKWDTGIDAVH